MTEQKENTGDFAPYDVEVEQAVLSSILRWPDRLPQVASILEPDDFYDPLHARIFEKMLVLDELERPVTPRTLHAVMKTDPGLHDVKAEAGDAWRERDNYLGVLADLGGGVYGNDELVDLARTIAALRVRREATDALLDAHDRLRGGAKIETALAEVVRVADQVALAEVQRSVSPGLGDAFERLAKEMDAASTKDRGLMTGWAPFDKQLGGFLPECFQVIAGRPGMGKSILGTNLLRIAGMVRDAEGRPVWLPTSFSLEMSQAENVARVIAEIDFRQCIKEGRTDPIHYASIIKNRLTNDQFTRYILIGQTLRELGVEVYDKAKMTMQRIAALARARHALNPGLKPFTLIDHIQIIEGAKHHKGNRLESLTEITGQCKALAKQLKGPVVGLSQLSRGVEGREDKRPNLSDLRESGSIEQDADAVMFLYRPEYYLRAQLRHAQGDAKKAAQVVELMNKITAQTGRLDIDVAKNRHGAVGDVSLWVDVASGAILESAPGTEPAAQAELPIGAEPLDGLADLAKRTGAP